MTLRQAPRQEAGRQGFTLIELMVVVLITAVLTGGGLATYGRFNRRQEVKLSGLQFYNSLRYAQSKAAASDKPVACTGTLEGYKVNFTSTSSYQVEVVCSDGSDPIVETALLKSGVELNSGVGEVSFFILGGGAEAVDFCLTGFSYYYLLQVTASGEVKDQGFVGSC